MQGDSPIQTESVTLFLRQWAKGDGGALDHVVQTLYNELHRLARNSLANSSLRSVSPATLVHDAYIRLRKSVPPECCDRGHFCALAAQLMRFILVDYLRAQSAAKRDAGSLTLAEPPDESGPSETGRMTILDIDDALEALAKVDPEKARVVEMRFFAGLTVEETAEALGISPATVKRHWSFARAWMKKWLTDRNR